MPSTASQSSRLCVYLVTDRRQTRGRSLLDCVAAAVRGGVRAVQLREKDLPTRDLLDLARGLREITRAHGAALLVNDRVDVALACDAEGVHLPHDSFALRDARALLGPGRLIGVSTHGTEEVRVAAEAGADFVVFGPIFDTPSKRPYGPPAGVAALQRAAVATLPVLAIGGVTAEAIPELMTHGAAGVAVIRAILAADDPETAARGLVGQVAERTAR